MSGIWVLVLYKLEKTYIKQILDSFQLFVTLDKKEGVIALSANISSG